VKYPPCAPGMGLSSTRIAIGRIGSWDT
jgi:hypothetical protein